MENKFDGYKTILEKYLSENRLRDIPPDRQSEEIIDLSGNDYLGLASNCGKLREKFMTTCIDSFTSSASRLLTSRQDSYAALENRLEELYKRPALLFNSGYHANVGCISALNIPGTVFLCDKLIHASVIDGISMSGAEYARWRHNDINHLQRLLEKYRNRTKRMIVVAESVYSMDGDRAPLIELINLKNEFPTMMLYLDEAHAFGVMGNQGLGLAEETGLLQETDIIIGTFGKAAASSGAFAITNPLLNSFLINNARSFIFSTAIPPINSRWTLEMLNCIVKMKDERRKLTEISEKFRNFISQITGTDNPSQSQIVPLIVGDAHKALEISNFLHREGIDALAIRRPTVPPGGERIRFSLHATLSSAEIERIMKTLQKLKALSMI